MKGFTLLAIDPGPTESAYVIYNGDTPSQFDKLWNDELLQFIRRPEVSSSVLVIERVASMGMAVGEDVFETVFWSGRFVQIWNGQWDRMKRHEVKSHLCHHPRAKDGNIRQALIDRWGGKDKAIGRKASPGPLYGMSGDCWQALALAVCYWDTHLAKGNP